MPSGDPPADKDDEHHATTPTARVLEELAAYGYHPGQDEPDPRPLPDMDIASRQIEAAADALTSMLADTRLEPDLEDTLWSFVGIFHRRADRIARELDDNEQAQRRSQLEQDGSEVKSVELERLLAQGLTLLERRNAFEQFRDMAAEHFEATTGSAWRPRTGSMVNHRTVTAAVIDSRDYITALRDARQQVLAPRGTRIAVTSNPGFDDHKLVWDALDKVRERHPDMVLLHGGAPKGTDLLAARWADHRKVSQIQFKPDWTRDRNAAPFKRNDRMLEAKPAGVVEFPGGGISQNLADKARALGIRVWTPRPRPGG